MKPISWFLLVWWMQTEDIKALLFIAFYNWWYVCADIERQRKTWWHEEVLHCLLLHNKRKNKNITVYNHWTRIGLRIGNKQCVHAVHWVSIQTGAWSVAVFKVKTGWQWLKCWAYGRLHGVCADPCRHTDIWTWNDTERYGKTWNLWTRLSCLTFVWGNFCGKHVW